MGNGISSIGGAAAKPAAFAVQKIPAHIQQRIFSCMGKVLFGDQALGCGVLIGIDRLLVPYHTICSYCPENLKVQFSEDSIFTVLRFLVMDPDRDFVILQLSCNGLFPGNQRWCAPLSHNTYQGEFLFASFTKERPSLISSSGAACGPAHFCSEVETILGCSGSGYFDRDGNLFALHLSRATGLCEYSSDTRRALYVADLWKNPAAMQILCISVCRPICPPEQRVSCANDSFFKDPCFTEEGPKAIRGKINEISYWEWKPGNNQGGGPRGLTVAVPNNREKIFYKFNPNPHGCRRYNKDPEPLYLEAARRFVALYESNHQTPRSFEFNAYGEEFTAAL